MCIGPLCGEGNTYCIVLVINTYYPLFALFLLFLNSVMPFLDLWVDGVVTEYVLADDSTLLVFDGYSTLFSCVNVCVTPLSISLHMPLVFP